MGSWLGHVQLKPHGDHLLTPSASFWLMSARVLVFIMATAEAVAWGYLGYLFGDGVTRWVGATFAGTIIFLVVWMIDASLITLDRAWREHAAALLGHDTSNRGRLVRSAVSFGVRIALLIGSLTITAPYLAQVVFRTDIQRFIDAEAAANLDAGRQQLARRLDSPIADKTREVDLKRSQYEHEVAGKGLSGRYGMGPAAKAMRDELDKIVAERDALAADRTSALAKYDDLARDWRTNRDSLAATYNVELPRTSILENRKALDELRKRPENASTELAIKAFLAFIFAGLLLLKLFEPSSVRLYFSEVLQQEYTRYLAGTFDDLLPPTERSRIQPTPMTPQRLYDFLARVWTRRVNVELEHVRDQLGEELKQAQVDHRHAAEDAAAARTTFAQLKSAIDIVEKDVASYRQQLADWDRSEKGALDGAAQVELTRLRSDFRHKLAEATRVLEGLVQNVPIEEGKVSRADAHVTQCDAKVRLAESELASVSKQLREARLKSPPVDFNAPSTASSAL